MRGPFWFGNCYHLEDGVPEQGRIAPCYKWNAPEPYKVIAHVWGPHADSIATESGTFETIGKAKEWVETRVKALMEGSR